MTSRATHWTPEDRAAYEHLCGTTCICGEPKKSMMSHCRACYFALPSEERVTLYRKIGRGYREAYDASVVRLRRIGRVRDCEVAR